MLNFVNVRAIYSIENGASFDPKKKDYHNLMSKNLPKDTIQKISERLFEKAVLYFEELQGEKVQVKNIPFKVKSSYPIFLFEIQGKSNHSYKVVTKFSPVFDDNNEALTEYTNMKQLYPVFASEFVDIGIPRPLDFLSDMNLLVVEYVQGEKFSDWAVRKNKFWSSEEVRSQLKSYVVNAGKWLSVFHNETKVEDLVFLESDIFSTIDGFIGRLKNFGMDEVLGDLTAFLKEVGPLFKDILLPVALIHGDFGLQNINVSGDKLYVFDLQRKHSEVIYHDICYFLITLETLNPYPSNVFFSRSFFIKLQKHFLEGYFGTGFCLENEMLIAIKLYYIRSLLQRILKQSFNIDRRGSKLEKMVFKQLIAQGKYKNIVNREMAEIRSLLG